MWDNEGAAGRCYQHLGPGLTPSRKGLAVKATRMCDAPQCDTPVQRRKWCAKHYQRWYRTGSVDAVGREPLPVDEWQGERWLPVVGYEGLYEVSDHGRVRSIGRVVPRVDGGLNAVPERILRTGEDKYAKVSLRKDSRTRKHYVHTLVLTTFVGPAPAGTECLHADDVGHHNHIENLRWGTHAENGHDRWDLHRKRDGAGYKLTADQARSILASVRQGERPKDIAERFGVSSANVSHIARGSTWAHLHNEVLPRAEEAS